MPALVYLSADFTRSYALAPPGTRAPNLPELCPARPSALRRITMFSGRTALTANAVANMRSFTTI